MIAASIPLILVAVVLLVAGLAGGSSPLLITSIATSLLAAVALVAGTRQAAAARAAAGRETGPRGRTAPTGPSHDGPENAVPYHASTDGTGDPGWRQPPGTPVAEPSDPPVATFDPPGEPYSPAGPYSPAEQVYPPAEPYPQAEPYPAGEPYSPPAPRGPSRAEAAFDTPPPTSPAPTSPAPTSPAPTSPAPDGPFEGEPPAEFLTDGEVARLVRLDGEVRVVDGHPRFHLPSCPQLVGRADEPLPVAEAVGLGFTPCGRCAPATTLLAETRPR
ncbi:hypothetical protein [Micromonospora sp. NPDC004551]|uniref:hypothetical protein n=1 Tax=Micromonospora sp. NPDC004551 TaxID=3154284 RepID=UPI0033AFEB41